MVIQFEGKKEIDWIENRNTEICAWNSTGRCLTCIKEGKRESNFFTIGNSKENEIAKWNLKILDNTQFTVSGKNEACVVVILINPLLLCKSYTICKPIMLLFR